MQKESLTLEEYGKAIKQACASFNGALDTVMAQTTVPPGGRWNGAQKQALLANHFMPTRMLRLITLRISERASRLAEAVVQLSPPVTLSEFLPARPPRWLSQCCSYGFDGTTARTFDSVPYSSAHSEASRPGRRIILGERHPAHRHGDDQPVHNA